MCLECRKSGEELSPPVGTGRKFVPPEMINNLKGII
jgi:hypothetical protein